MYDTTLRRGVAVTTAPGQAEPSAVALSVLSGVLWISRGMLAWSGERYSTSPNAAPPLPPDLVGQTAVVVGDGPVGSEIARLLEAVSIRTVDVACTRGGDGLIDGIRDLRELDEVLTDCDWLILACRPGEATWRLIDAHRLRRLAVGAGLVNVAHANIVDEQELADALASGRLAGAYLDVCEPWQPSTTSPLRGLPNVIIGSHNCSTFLGIGESGPETFLRNLAAYVRGEPLQNLADRRLPSELSRFADLTATAIPGR
jgi:phosphoglycerate dehydrogenase-like enzyme